MSIGNNTPSKNEQKLRRIERKVEADTEYRREAIRARKDVEQLLRDRYIDRPHAELLIDAINAKAAADHTKYLEAKSKRDKARQFEKDQDTGRWVVLAICLFWVFVLSLST